MPYMHGKSPGTQRTSNLIPVSERQQLALVKQMTSDAAHMAHSDDSNVEVDKRNERGETPLHLAAIRGDLAQVTSLLDRGADPNVNDFAGWSPLHEACNHGWLEVARLLLSRGGQVNARGLHDDTPLHDAAVNNHLQLVKLLVEWGADPTLRNKRGKTPADVAASPEANRILEAALTSASTSNQSGAGGKAEAAEPPAEQGPHEQTKPEMRRLPPQGKEKCGSPRVTLRIHQLKKEKGKPAPTADPADTPNNTTFENSANTEAPSIKGNGEETLGSQGVEGEEEESKEGEETAGEGEGTKRPLEEEEESRKRRRKEAGSEGEGSAESPGPKVPPLKIVIPGAGEAEQARKSSGRHSLPYVVAADDAPTTASAAASPEPPSQEAPSTQPHDDSHKRVLRSHRSGNGSSGQSGNSSPAGAEGGSPGGRLVSPPPESSGAGTGTTTGTEAGASGPDDAPKEQTSEPAVELHPRKRKLKPREQPPEPEPQPIQPPPPPHEPAPTPPTNCYQLYLNIRKQIDRRRKGLFPVQPKPPQGFKDYLMNRCTYVLAGNNNNRIPAPTGTPPTTVLPEMKDMFILQEKERYRLRTQHVIEKEKLVLSVEQEILRVHGRAARALANQALPFSACTILRDEEIYSPFTAEQEEKERNARSRYNGRLFISWLQDVDDKWEKIKEAMLLRHHNEAESLHAVQKMDWEWKLKEVTPDSKGKPCTVDDSHVPMVHVSDDFDLLPA